MHTFRKAITSDLPALIVVGLLSAAFLTSTAAAQKKPSAPAPKAAPARAPSAAPKSGGSAAGGSHTTTTGGSHTTTGAATTHGPTANGAGAHTTTTAGAHTTTTAGAHTTTTGGAHTTTAAGAHTTGAAGGAHATTASHTPIKSGPAPKGSNEHVTKSGSAVRTRADGRVSDVHDAKRGMDVHHNLGGGRRVSVERRDGSRVFAERGRAGYVERGYHYHGHDFARRSYFYHGHEYNAYYRGWGYRGLMLNVYAPGFYFAPDRKSVV